MESTQETVEQLPLSVKVSAWSGIAYNIRKFFREFAYTGLAQVPQRILFWVNGGLVAFVFFFLLRNMEIWTSARGVTLIPAANSELTAVAAASVTQLSVLQYYWWGMLFIFVFFTFVSMTLYSSGRTGIVSYLFSLSLVLLLLLTRVIVSPVLLLGGTL